MRDAEDLNKQCITHAWEFSGHSWIIYLNVGFSEWGCVRPSLGLGVTSSCGFCRREKFHIATSTQHVKRPKVRWGTFSFLLIDTSTYCCKDLYLCLHCEQCMRLFWKWVKERPEDGSRWGHILIPNYGRLVMVTWKWWGEVNVDHSYC